MEKKLIIVKPKTLSPKDKEELTKAGNIVIEHPSPGDMIFKSHLEEVKYVYTNCYVCGERIYITEEKMTALKQSKILFYCSSGHSQRYK